MTSPEAIADFFTAPNEVGSSPPGRAGELLALLAHRLVEGQRAVLPARANGATRWYGIAPSEREGRVLREELRVWLGPPISALLLELHASSDPLDVRARHLVPSGIAIRVDILDQWRGVAQENVSSLVDTWNVAPERSIDQPRPVGRVLRQFYESLLASDRQSAESALEEIRLRRLLTATNVRFLRLELLSVMGSPREVLSDPTLRDISHTARPPAVTERLAAAANSIFIEPTATRDPNPDWPEVARQIEEAWPGLVVNPSQATDLATARCLAIVEATSPEPRQDFLQTIHDRFRADTVVASVIGDLSALQESDTEAVTRTAIELYQLDDYEGALLRASTDRTRENASIALLAAMNLNQPHAAVLAIEIVDSLAPETRERIFGTTVERSFYEHLLERTSDAAIPASWLDWVKDDWVDRPDLLAEWSRQWPRSPDAIESDRDALLIEVLDALNDGRRSRLRNGIPILTEWLVSEGLPIAAVGLAVTLFDIVLSSEPGRTERGVALVLLEEILNVGCSQTEYGELLDALGQQLALLGPRDAAWLAQALDLLLLFGSPMPSRRAALLGQALGVASSWIGRAEAADASVLRLVFAAGGVSLAVPDSPFDDEPEAAPARSFGSVGIYSLLESASNVASRWIKELFPGVEVATNSDHVSTDRLRTMARTSDVVIIQIGHAKHPATRAIEEAVLDASRLVWVRGRGASALVRSLLAWANEETVAS